jgi:hypothetical protein
MAAAWASGEAKFTPKYVNSSGGACSEALAATAKARHLGDEIGHPVRWLNEQGPAFSIIRKGTDTETRLLSKIWERVQRGEVVTLGLEVKQGQWFRHSVLAVGVTEDGDILLNDPASGAQSRLSHYRAMPTFSGYDMADAIRR